MSGTRAALCAMALAGVALVVWGERVYTQGAQPRPARGAWPPVLSAPARGEVEVVPVGGNVHMIVGAGANVTVQAGEQGVLLVDTGSAAMSGKVIAAVKSISAKPLRYVVNTTHFEDHVGGNEAIAKTGEIIPFREVNYTAGPQGALDTKKASVISYLTVFHRMAAGKPPLAEDAWPDNTFSTEQKRLYFNDEPVVMQRLPSNTDGSVVVLFRKSDVVSAGDLLDLTGYPRIDLEAGGSLDAVVDSLNRLIELTVPAANAAGGTRVVPGHGRIADHAEVAYYRDMTAIVRDRIQDMLARRMTLAEIKAAGPTRDWDTRYGRSSGAWTTEMFVDAAFRSLSR